MHSNLSFYQKQLMKTVSWLSYQEEFSGWTFLFSGYGYGYGKKPAQVPTLMGSLTKEKTSLFPQLCFLYCSLDSNRDSL